MILIVAWRNIWRNKTRSRVLIASIAMGVWAGILLMSYSFGMIGNWSNTTITDQVSHIQIHDSLYLENQSVNAVVPGAAEIISELENDERVKGVTGRLKLMGMFNTSHKSTGVTILGVDTTMEKMVTTISTRVDTGKYLSGFKSKTGLIGRDLAEKADLEVGKRFTLQFTLPDGSNPKAKYKVAGLFRTASGPFDKGTIFVEKNVLAGQLGMDPGASHEIAILLNDIEKTDEVLAELQAKYPRLVIQGWKDIAPELGYSNEMIGTGLMIFMSVIMIALAFGIINTMMMAVLERTRELGILMAIGMNKWRTFSMVVLESVLYTFIGGPVGLLLGFLTVSYGEKYGIDVSAAGDAYRQMGIEARLYLELEPQYYLMALVMVIATSILGSAWPAWKAIKLNPSTAIRKI